MKRFLKLLAITISSLLLLLFVLTITAKVFEDDIAKIAIKKVSKSINAPIEIGSINVNLVRAFPHATIAFNDLWLKTPNENNEDTIAGIKRMYVSISSQAALNGQYVIERIALNGLTVNYEIDGDSISNVDFLMGLIPTVEEDTTTTTDSTLFYVDLDQVLFKNITCSYHDSTSNTGARVHIPEIKLSGNIMGENYIAESNGKITMTDVHLGETNIGLMKEASLDFNIKYEEEDVTINNFSLISDGVEISANGNAKIAEELYIDARVEGTKVDIEELSKYIPQELMEEFGIISTSGLLSFNSTIKGEYNDSIAPQVDAEFELKNGQLKTIDYPEIKSFTFKGTASNGKLRTNTSSSLNIEALKVSTANSYMTLKFNAENLDRPKYKINSKGAVLLEEFADFIPDSIAESITGRFKWAMGTSGRMPKVIGDNFTDYVMAYSWANLSVENINIKVNDTLSIEDFSGEMAYHPNNIVIKELQLKVPSYDVKLQNSSADIGFNGSVNNTDAMACNIRNIHLEMEDNVVDFGATLSNLTEPDYNFNGTMQLNLEQLQKFAPDTLITSMAGRVFASLKSEGKLNLDSLETQGMALAFENSTMGLECKNVDIIMPDTLMEVRNFNIAMGMKPDTIDISSFSADYKGLVMNAKNTQIINAYNTAVLNKKEKLEVITSIQLGDIDYELFAPFMIEEAEESTESELSNYSMDIKGDFTAQSFSIANYEVDSTMTIKHFDIENISSKFRITDSTYIADSLEFNSFGGYLNTSMRYDLKAGNKAVISCRNHIDGMDFKQLLFDMDNFGQEDLTHENISGVLLSDINAEFTMIGDSIPMDLIRMSGDFELSEGGIYNFEPAEELSKFTGIKELDNIRFQTLNTRLFVFKGAAYAPKTDIVSTAMDVTAFGMQTFGEDYEYHLELNMGDVLTGKSENLLKRQAKAAKDADEEVNRNGVNLIVYSLDGKTKNGFDNKKSITKMNNKIRVQERFLNLVFHHNRINYNTYYEKNDTK